MKIKYTTLGWIENNEFLISVYIIYVKINIIINVCTPL